MNDLEETIAFVIGEVVNRALAPLKARIAALEAKPTLKDGGDWTHGQVYDPGTVVRHRGSAWICQDTHLSTGDDLDHGKFKLWLKRHR